MDVCLPKRLLDVFYYGMRREKYLSNKWREIAYERQFLCVKYRETVYKVNVTPDMVTLIITSPGFNHQFDVLDVEKEECSKRCYDLILTVCEKDTDVAKTMVFSMNMMEEAVENMNRWKYDRD